MPLHYTRGSLLDRLQYQSVRIGNCLVWQGLKDRGGYGRINRDRVHRVAYRLLVGPIPAGHEVQHSCNVPACWEPTHLSTGTPKQNSEYRVTCGRQARGERQGLARLSDGNVRQIRARYAEGGITFRDLGRQYDVAERWIAKIIRRQAWTHLD